MKQLTAYQGPEHEPFDWNVGRPAALLVHGFPGTPAEMRPLGAALRGAGWTVAGPLLPGFGAEIETLARRRHAEWAAAVDAGLARLRADHDPVLLVGYSMGAALALQAAARQPPAGLILLAPFWQLVAGWQQAAWPLFKLVIRRFRPFEKADFADAEVRRGIANFMPEADLDDPEVRRAIREIYLPTRVLDEVRRAGRAAAACAPRAALPTLVIQGTRDEVVRAERTRRLLARLPEGARYHEVPAGHDLIRPGSEAWPEVERLVLDFARGLKSAAHAE